MILDGPGGRTIVADPRLDVSCSTWASSALDGPAYRGLRARILGTDDSWWSWHVRELGIALVTVLPAGAILLVRRRRRRRRRRFAGVLAPSES